MQIFNMEIHTWITSDNFEMKRKSHPGKFSCREINSDMSE